MIVNVKIEAGAGGQESQAWAAMVLRMYVRWTARRGLSIAPGRDIHRTGDGIQSAELTIEGGGAQRLLTEDGVHRLVRVSPFDPTARRHTSFASVDVTDESGQSPGYQSTSWCRGQVRSYVLHPYRKAKDLRTGQERDDVEAVLDGDIDDFLDGAAAIGLPRKHDPNGPIAEAATMDAT